MINGSKRPKPDVDQAWQKFYTQLKADGLAVGQVETKKHAISPSFWRWSAAALLCALFVGVGAGVYFWTQSSYFEMVVVQNNEIDEALVATLPDGSVALLSGKSRITYHQPHTSSPRRVAIEGEAFFDVFKDERCPFIIETEQVTVEVVGTSFRMRSDEACPFELTVKSGIVKVVLLNIDQNVYVESGEQVQLIANSLQKSNVEDVRISGQGVNRLYFKEESLGQIIKIVNAYSDESAHLAFEDESLLKRNFTITLDVGSVEGIADLLCDILSLQQKRVDNVIYLSEK